MNWNWAVFHVIFSEGALAAVGCYTAFLCGIKGARGVATATTFQGDYSRMSFQLYYFPSRPTARREKKGKEKNQNSPFSRHTEFAALD